MNENVLHKNRFHTGILIHIENVPTQDQVFICWLCFFFIFMFSECKSRVIGVKIKVEFQEMVQVLRLASTPLVVSAFSDILFCFP